MEILKITCKGTEFSKNDAFQYNLDGRFYSIRNYRKVSHNLCNNIIRNKIN